ncbi:hypothetical protein CJ030_MR3G026062 [Morella rubra]|uniref:Uncharacterized protein n=1 Tax=Morella rubra TaxID=262757 RepID=A0A6A1VZ04_9ROSI|nr:hypothetical protein CJ030_MR3G026062 [Morella rubra]
MAVSSGRIMRRCYRGYGLYVGLNLICNAHMAMVSVSPDLIQSRIRVWKSIRRIRIFIATTFVWKIIRVDPRVSNGRKWRKAFLIRRGNLSIMIEESSDRVVKSGVRNSIRYEYKFRA